MERHFSSVWTLTQNVDGFHRRAGSENVLEIHGDLHRLTCTHSRCLWRREIETYNDLDDLPRCPECNAVVRPDVVLFGEMLPQKTLASLRIEREKGFDAVFSVGTSSLFEYIIEPIQRARESGIPTVEINPGETEVSELVDIRIKAGAAEALDAIWSSYLARLGKG
jgi:NAD-dependent deacetylase